MAISENRRGNRVKYGHPEFVYAELNLGKNIEMEKAYNLKILDCSKYGLGMIITQKDFDILSKINEGDTLRGISFFSERTMIKIDGTVRHKSKIDEGKYTGCYILGIESPDIIETT